MSFSESLLKYDEKTVFSLRELYGKYGYSQYKMSKFEEYDLYVRNKDFLISDHVITFTDTNGKLMALKPDVTLSIIKNSKDLPETVQKVYYDENVYRVSKGTQSFKEIMQVGLECIGNLDDYCLYEVLMLAAKSLQTISSDCVLDISHLGILSSVLDYLSPPAEIRDNILQCIGEKNLHGLCKLCSQAGIEAAKTEVLKKLISLYGKPEEILPALKRLLAGIVDVGPLEQLNRLIDAFGDCTLKEMLRIDFSVISDMKYYNGIVFKGFVQGIPNSILSGGQYDKLMQKMHRSSGAIGFAVYLDQLERLDENGEQYDVDAVLLYDRDDDLQAIARTVSELTASGIRVLLQRTLPEKIKYKYLMQWKNGEVNRIENDA